MGNCKARIWLAACVLLVGILTGCAGMPGSGPLALDPIRLGNAIVADDVGYVRGAVEAKVVGVDQIVPASAYMEGTPIITIAARAGALNVLRYLISAGANVNTRTPAGETPLMLAAYFRDEQAPGGPSYERHEAAVQLLVASGSSLENQAYHYTPLAYAAYQGRLRTMRFLLERGARVDPDVEQGATYVNTPLMMASMMGHLDCAVLLLEAGADPRVRVRGGMTARELALKHRHDSVARTLACAEGLGHGEKIRGRCQ